MNVEIGNEVVVVPDSLKDLVVQMGDPNFINGLIETLAGNHAFNQQEVTGILQLAQVYDSESESLRRARTNQFA